MQHTNIRLLLAAARPRVYFIEIWARDPMAHDEEQDGHSAVKQKPVDSLKNTHLWVVAPAWILSFEGRVRNVAEGGGDAHLKIKTAPAGADRRVAQASGFWQSHAVHDECFVIDIGEGCVWALLY